jgi:hypothetical protein
MVKLGSLELLRNPKLALEICVFPEQHTSTQALKNFAAPASPRS